jgi:hypothetical protein
MASNGQTMTLGNSVAPEADEALIARARRFLKPGQPLGGLFASPSEDAKQFLRSLGPREKAGLENTSRTIR